MALQLTEDVDEIANGVLYRRYVLGENYIKTSMELHIAESTYYKKLRQWKKFITAFPKFPKRVNFIGDNVLQCQQ